MIKFRCIPKASNFYGALEYEDFPYKVGERIGQIFLQKIIPLNFIQSNELTETQRGTGGFGSTGTN